MKLEWFLATMTKEKNAPSAMEMSSVENERTEMSTGREDSSGHSRSTANLPMPAHRPGPLSSKKRKEEPQKNEESSVVHSSPRSEASLASSTKSTTIARPCPRSKKLRLSTESNLAEERGDCNANIKIALSPSSQMSDGSDSKPQKRDKPCPRSRKISIDEVKVSHGDTKDPPFEDDNHSVVSKTSGVSIKSIKSGTACPRSKKPKESLAAVDCNETQPSLVAKGRPCPRSKRQEDGFKQNSRTDDETASSSSKNEQASTSVDSDYESKSYSSSISVKSKTDKDKKPVPKPSSSAALTLDKPVGVHDTDTRKQGVTAAAGPALTTEEIRRKCLERIRAAKEAAKQKQLEEQASNQKEPVANVPIIQSVSLLPCPEQKKMMEQWTDAISKLKEQIGVPENLDDVLKQLLNARQICRLQESLQENKPLYLFEAVLPHISKDLRFADLLNCRLVCPRWTKSVDDLLENHPYRQGLSGNDSDDESNFDFSSNRVQNPFNRRPFKDRHDKQRSFFHLFNLEKVQSLLSSIKSHSRNPFVTRAVLVRSSLILSESELAEFWNSVLGLFKIHGENVWHLQLQIQGYKSKDDIFPLICRVLNQTRNLRSLEILCPSIEDPGDELPLPDLRHLDCLDLSAAKFPISLVNSFLDKYSQTLRSLWVSLYRWNETQAKAIKNLKHLQITSLCVQENLNHLYSQLGNIKDLNSLTKLSLTFMVPVKAKSLFGSLQYLKDLRTIRILMLENTSTNPRLQDSSSSSSGLPSLPNVHTLELTLSSHQRTFKFLGWFPTLTHLHLMTEPSFMDTLDQEDFSKSGHHDRISRYLRKCIIKKSAAKSSLWSHLPTLQVLTFLICRRSGKHEDLIFIREKCIYLT